MPIISAIGRRSLKTRMLVGGIYALLLTGAVTMVYPFLLMLAGSTKSGCDVSDAHLMPPFLRDDTALYCKHMEGFFNESLDMAMATYDTKVASFAKLEAPAVINLKFVDEWRAFLAANRLPLYAFTVGYVEVRQTGGVLPHLLRAFRQRLIERFHGDMARLNATMGTDLANWSNFRMVAENYLARGRMPGREPLDRAFNDFKTQQPSEARYYFNLEGFYKSAFLEERYSKAISVYNAAHGTRYGSWGAVHLDRRLPQQAGRTAQEQADWETFVRLVANPLWLQADEAAAPIYRRFLRAKYGRLETVNARYGAAYRSFDDIPLVTEPAAGGLRVTDWDAFLQGWTDPATGQRYVLPVDMIQIHSVEFMFRDWLRARHGSLASLNQALAASPDPVCNLRLAEFTDWLAVLPPQREFHYLVFLRQSHWLRWEFARRNFIAVFDYIAVRGRALLNTAVYCTLAILTALLVNPLAAYALSRFKPRSTYKVLLFLMLTMAFPPMVTQIPLFLMVRGFNLLNTFWALILPALANGYWIFLLKGFFDSLPPELFECAALDGASELQIFWRLTMSLSKPVLAVIALNAFTGAYANFMMALLICQDQNMWTLMPWLYQLQMHSAQGIIFASLIVAAVPTFLVFALCQNVIMRGIVVPVEK